MLTTACWLKIARLICFSCNASCPEKGAAVNLEETETTAEDEPPCGQDFHRLESTLAKVLSSGEERNMGFIELDPMGHISIEPFSFEIEKRSIQHASLLFGNIALIIHYLKTNVGEGIPHGTGEGFEAHVGRALGCYFASDLDGFFKVYQNMAEFLQKKISIAMESAEGGDKQTTMLVAEYLKDPEPELEKIDRVKNELRKKFRSKTMTEADAKAFTRMIFEAMKTGIEKVSTVQKQVKVVLHDHQEQLHHQQKEIDNLKAKLEAQNEMHFRELKHLEDRHRQAMQDCKEDIRRIYEQMNIQAQEREAEMEQHTKHIEQLQIIIEDQETKLDKQKNQLEIVNQRNAEAENRNTEMAEDIQRLQDRTQDQATQIEDLQREKEGLEGGFRKTKLVYKVVGGIGIVVVCTLAGGLIGCLLGPIGGIIGAEIGACLGGGLAIGATVGVGFCVITEAGMKVLNN